MTNMPSNHVRRGFDDQMIYDHDHLQLGRDLVEIPMSLY